MPNPARKPAPAQSKPDRYTGLPILIGKSVFDRAMRRFEHHFWSALADFKQNRKGPLQRQVWKEFRDAEPNDWAGEDVQFLESLTRSVPSLRLPDGSLPNLIFRQRGDLLFVCIPKPDKLVVIYPAKADPLTGRPVLEASSHASDQVSA